MIDGLDKYSNEEDVLKIILENKFSREDSHRTYNFSGDIVDACIDSSKYADPIGLRLSINDEVLKFLDSKDETFDKLKLAEMDETNVLLAYLVSNHRYCATDISSLIKSGDSYLELVGTGLAIIYELPQIIPASSDESLYKYFRSREISKESLGIFSSDSFINFSFSKMLKEERVVFTWMVNNLTSLIEIDAIDIDENSTFLVKLLRENDYPNETHRSLYFSALKKKPYSINKIVGMKLNIDPFTKQTNYTKWLKEVRMFNFIFELRNSLSKQYVSEDVSKFDGIKAYFYNINKGDSGLLM